MSHGSIEPMFPMDSFKSPSWTRFDNNISPPSVKRSRNRAISQPFLNEDGKVSSEFLLPSLRDESPSRSLRLNMTLDKRFPIPFTINPRLGKDSELKPKYSYYSDFSTSDPEHDLETDNMQIPNVVRCSNIANAA